MIECRWKLYLKLKIKRIIITRKFLIISLILYTTKNQGVRHFENKSPIKKTKEETYNAVLLPCKELAHLCSKNLCSENPDYFNQKQELLERGKGQSEN